MAVTIACNSTSIVSLSDFIDYVDAKVDLHNEDSIATASTVFRSLANDRDLVVRQLNQLVKNEFKGEVLPSSQAILLGHGKNFFVRANIWPSNADIAGGRVYQDNFSYHLAHDHNYSFLTMLYHGPGYVTEIYEYDRDRIQGLPGERVDLRFLERQQLGPGMAMLYRAGKDVHTQFPPNDLSLTLNLMITLPDVRLQEQYFFDVQNGTLLDHPLATADAGRSSLLKVAGLIGDGNTEQMLHDLSRRHPNRSSRLAAFESLAQLNPAGAARYWESAAGDPEPLIKQTAQSKLRALSG